MDTSPAVSPPHGTASVHPIPEASADPCHERTRSVDKAGLPTSTANDEQNDKVLEFLFQIESWPKQMSYNRNNSTGALSMVREEGESFRSVDTRHSVHQIPPVKKKRSKSKTSACLTCFIYPLRKARDMYINCCFQFADAGDLAGLVGGGHTVGARNLFPVGREDSDQEDFEEMIVRRRRAAAGREYM